jgi:hypothetical protein
MNITEIHSDLKETKPLAVVSLCRFKVRNGPSVERLVPKTLTRRDSRPIGINPEPAR